ncbi:MAG TPA: hypothetical protein VJ739_18550 [Gemmataceae bacterium]|nr:hypothetical protein [Gemmataceae bacterium]
MRFDLPGFRSRTPVVSLGGAFVRYKPVLPLTVLGPTGQETRRVLLDSASDDIVFPLDLATRLGMNLTAAPRRAAQGVGGTLPVSLWFAPVILLLSDQVETCRWRAVVAFTPTPLRFPLFGIAGGLEYFRTTLDVADREILLYAKPSLPVTQDPVP